ncbi:hypothetical protein [Thermosulfurimonas sp. F29]|uniref:hypothetical protein n=1 Tax=Thermosulfurimonas sp. F29 TaxID=2867247 RepID=UPI001C8408A8|nr:hypothetical protein [Thermosulfurimonas sp. F29]MBX6424166.1 hypothetical protein [Thermosulfurimonas sp. F29]
MSYTIIRAVSIRDGKVYLTTAESNVRPIAYAKFESPLYTKILREKGKSAVLATLLVHTMADGDVFLAGSKLDKLRHFVFEWWGKEDLNLRHLDLEKRDHQEEAIEYLTEQMPAIFEGFRRVFNERERHLVLINGDAISRVVPHRKWNEERPGENKVRPYMFPLYRNPWEEDFPWGNYLVFPNQFEADYFARCRLPLLYWRDVAILSETGRKEFIKRLVPLRWETHIEPIFEQALHQREALETLYREVFGVDFDRAKTIIGWPRVNPKDHYRLTKLFSEFDRKCHPDVLPGGLWMNAGFSADESVPEGYADLSGIVIKFEVEEKDQPEPSPILTPQKQKPEEERESGIHFHAPCPTP